MKTNLTLTLDADLLKAARRLALEKDTSVNQLVRDYLEKAVEETDRKKANAERLRRIFKSSKAELGGRSWTREELHER